MSYTYDFPRPSVTVDCIVFHLQSDQLSVLLIERKDEPFEGRWAFPGGFIEMEEELEESASRELMEETGLQWSGFEQLGAFGKVGRDPRGRTISVAFIGFVKNPLDANAASDASQIRWFNVNDLPAMAFDHNEVYRQAIIFLERRMKEDKPGELPFNLQSQEIIKIKSIINGRQKIYGSIDNS